MKFITTFIIATLVLLSLPAQAGLVPSYMYERARITNVQFDSCTANGESVYALDVGSSRPMYTEYVSIKGIGAPYNGGYITLSLDSQLSSSLVSVPYYNGYPSRTLYFKYDDGDTTSVNIKTSFWKDEPDQYGPQGRWTEYMSQNLTSFSGFDYNNGCNGAGGATPAVPTITKVSVYNACMNMAKVEFDVEPGTTRTELVSTSGANIYWAGSASSTITEFPNKYIKARACNAAGCSGLSSIAVVGNFPSSSCQAMP